MFGGYDLPARVVNTLHSDSGGRPFLAVALGGAFTHRVPRRCLGERCGADRTG